MRSFVRRTIFYKIYKKLVARTANIISGFPSSNMTIIGITGTDGKSTTCNLVHQLLNKYLGKTLLISTINIKIGDKEKFNDTKMTSLGPFALQSIINQAKQEGCKYAVLEVSSHGLDQYRFEGIEFDLGLLTNLTAEHLDYHITMDNYANAKKSLFKSILKNSKSNKYAVFPKDNEYGRQWMEEMAFDKELDFGIYTSSTVKAENINEYKDRTEFSLKYLGKSYDCVTPILGKFNLYNILSVVSVGLLLGIKIEDIINDIQNFQPLPGRLNLLQHKGVFFYIDFAHATNALSSVLDFLNSINEGGNIITVFGAPGNRDKYKRPYMGDIVEKKSNKLVLTDDDPDTENRYKIINHIRQGVKRHIGDDFFIIPEREFALKFVYEIACEGDIVLIAGKGHEEKQITNFGKRERNDIKYLKSLFTE